MADHPQVTSWADQIARAGRPGPGGPGIAEGSSLLIVGPTGTGKTYQAYGAVRALLTRAVRLRWEATTTADLYARLRPRPGHDAERDLQALARSPLLLLDDLGAAKRDHLRNREQAGRGARSPVPEIGPGSGTKGS